MFRSEQKMSSEALLSRVIPFAGSGLLGYAMGFALKKILKWVLIVVGFIGGMFFVGVQLLQRYGYVSAVNCSFSSLFYRMAKSNFTSSNIARSL
jgi:uncharacterized membrane protein (Fun14 family)